MKHGDLHSLSLDLQSQIKLLNLSLVCQHKCAPHPNPSGRSGYIHTGAVRPPLAARRTTSRIIMIMQNKARKFPPNMFSAQAVNRRKAKVFSLEIKNLNHST